MSVEDDILIERFLNGTLTEEEKNTVLNRMAINEAFKEKVLFEKELLETLNEEKWNSAKDSDLNEIKAYAKKFHGEDVIALKKVLKDVNEEYQTSRKKGSNIRYLYAAIIVTFIIIGALMTQQLNSSAPQELYVEYLALKELPSLVSRGSESDLTKGQQQFEAGAYESALILLQKAMQTQTQQKGIIYTYIGISQLELEQYNEAEKTFDQLSASNLIDASKGYWYNALVYLKQEKLEKTKDALQNIIKKKLYNHKKASQLLKALE